MLTNAFVTAVAMASTASAFECAGRYFNFFNRAGPMSYQRLDPALSPGKQSPHMHSFDGGNALEANANFDMQMGSSCSTARVKQDKSLYWRPTLYWNGNNTGFHRVPENSAKIYYKFGDDDNWANVTEFPEDFSMIAGDPFKRSEGDDPAGIRWACHSADGTGKDIFTNGFPTGFQSCKTGFAVEITFPSCWNGQKLDPSKPSAHMAWPTNMGVGLDKCPTTHRTARFPTIFIEFWYNIESFNGQYSSSSSPWVLANGDPTGFGFHADFLNGWEKGVLAKATAEDGYLGCGCGCSTDDMKTYFGAENVNDDEKEWAQCKASASDAEVVVDKLPGCNPVQSGPARATVVTGAGCDATPMPGGNSAPPASTSAAEPEPTMAYPEDPSMTESPDATVTSSAKGTSAGGMGAPTSSTSGPLSSSAANMPNASRPTPSPSSKSRVPHSMYHSSAASVAAAIASDIASPADTTKSMGSGQCKAAVTVTQTPTVYITVGADQAVCSATTTTVTKTSTVTVTASP